MSSDEAKRLADDITATAAATWLLDSELGARWDGIKVRLAVALDAATVEGHTKAAQHIAVRREPERYDGVSGRWVQDQIARLASLMIQQRNMKGQVVPPPEDAASEYVNNLLRGLLREQSVSARMRKDDVLAANRP